MDPQYAYQTAPANFMPMMAGGGLADAAQQLQGQGRGGDSMLVHMTPGEVKGLQALAMSQGGSLTINPSTGLPEAKFLKRLLPTLIGAGLSFIPGVGPLMAAGLVGGAETLRTGNLGKGLMAGLGAFGGANIAAGLAGSAAAAGAGAGAAPSAYQSALSNLGPAAESMSAAQVAQTAPMAQQAAIAGEGFKGLGSAAGRSGFMSGVGGAKGALMTAGALAAPSMLAEQPASGPTGSGTYLRPYTFTRTPRPDAYSSVPSPGAGSVERRYFDDTFTAMPIQKVADFAAGGPIDMDPGIDPSQNVNVNKISGTTDAYAMGGLTAFARGGLPPRYLQGDGDGMSDSIKANIDGKQEARLADGEFVIPADVVAHLGNGSSNAGAKRLHSMMDRIRQARTGRAKQAPQVKAERYLPA